MTEVTAYKQTSGNTPDNPSSPSKALFPGSQSSLFLLVTLIGLTAAGIALFVSQMNNRSDEPLTQTQTHTADVPPTQKTFFDSTAQLKVQMNTKWTEEKVYTKVLVTPVDTSLPMVQRWSFYLLDADGYLLYRFEATEKNFIRQLDSLNRVVTLQTQHAANLSLADYQRLVALKVALDGTVR